MAKKPCPEIREEALQTFRDHGGVMRTAEAVAAGIHPRILYELRNKGLIEPIEYGLFALTDLPDIQNPDFVIVSKKIPDGVICLISALYHYQLTVQIPRWIDIALPQKTMAPRLTAIPIRYHWFSEKTYRLGVSTETSGKVPIHIYGPEKTIIDCFRLRHKVGTDVALEALKTYWNQGHPNIELLLEIAKLSRVSRIFNPYLEVVLHDQS